MTPIATRLSIRCSGRLPAAESAGIELHLETSLAPEEFAALLARIPHPLVKVNYDSGNSSSLGYRPAEEFAAYGERLGACTSKIACCMALRSPWAKGDADLEAVFAGLRRLNYGGDFILQVARGTTGDEVAWARQNRAYVERYLDINGPWTEGQSRVCGWRVSWNREGHCRGIAGRRRAGDNNGARPRSLWLPLPRNSAKAARTA